MKKLFILLLLLFTIDSSASGIASNTTSAPCTNNTLETYSGNSNLSADWQPNTINLTWYNENEKLTVQQSAQSCTYDGTLTIPSTPPTRTGYTFAGWKVRLPGTYTELEYLKSTRTQWIDTNFIPDNNTRIKTKIQLDSDGTSGLFGSILALDSEHNNGYNTGFESFFYTSNQKIYFFYGNAISVSGSHHLTDVLSINDVIEIDWNKNVLNYKINNGDTVQYIFPAQTFTTGYNMHLFSLSRGNYDEKGRSKIYYFQIYDNNVLVRDFIPARRNSDGVLGMYDIVTQTFFTNAGTGDFVAGPVVQ